VKRAQDEFREDFNIRRNEEMAKLQKLIQDAITALAQEERYDLVLNDGAVIFASEAVDITDKVLKRLSAVHGN
ncbi:MAG: OmpH family outer membrane protein, partial [Proteobacteria bacterium]|nr:OmpH family outer membrane protein [Pseudomonadota bacterium]